MKNVCSALQSSLPHRLGNFSSGATLQSLGLLQLCTGLTLSLHDLRRRKLCPCRIKSSPAVATVSCLAGLSKRAVYSMPPKSHYILDQEFNAQPTDFGDIRLFSHKLIGLPPEVHHCEQKLTAEDQPGASCSCRSRCSSSPCP